MQKLWGLDDPLRKDATGGQARSFGQTTAGDLAAGRDTVLEAARRYLLGATP